MKPIIKINLNPKDYAGHINLGNRVGASLLGNSSFTTPAVPLVNLTTAVSSCTAALSLWAPIGGRGSHADLLDLRDKTLTLRNLLISEANYVQTTAQISAGNDYSAMAAIIGTSGFEMKSPKSPQGVLEMVQGLHRFVSRQLAPNQLKLKWKKPLNVTTLNNVKDYRIMRAATADFATAVEIGASTKSSFVVTNTTGAPLTATYWVLAFNSAGAGVPSDALTVTILNA